MNDRRRFPRFNAKWRLKYQCSPKEKPVEQDVLDISGGGVRFRTNHAIEPGTTLTIELEAHPLPASILASAKVVWCRRIEERYEVGAEFQWRDQPNPVYEVGAQFVWIGWKDELMNQGETAASTGLFDLFPEDAAEDGVPPRRSVKEG